MTGHAPQPGTRGEPVPGWVAPELAAELPGLRLLQLDAPAAHGRSPAAVRARLRELSDRFGGAQALELRRQAVPAAYRVAFRHLGLDPDVDRPPAEAVVLERLLHGGFRSSGMPGDALLLAVVETRVAIWALDADRVDGPLGLRTAMPGERLGAGELAPDLADGRIVVADDHAAAAVLFGAIAAELRPGRATRRLRLFAVGVAGVPEVHLEEALWVAAEALGTAHSAG